MQPDFKNTHKDDNSPASRLDLQKLYPTPKTFKELKRARMEREMRREGKKPKHVFLLLSFQLLAIIIGFILAIFPVPYLIKWNPISGVFFCFLIAYIFFAYSAWMISLISSVFYKFGMSARPFLTTYAFTFVLLTSLAYGLVGSKMSLPAFLCLAAILHFVLVYVLVKLTFRTQDN